MLVQDDLAGGVERVLDFNMLLHSAGAVSVSQLFESKKTGVQEAGMQVCRYAGMGRAAMRCNAVWAAERMSPSPIDGAERNNRVTVEVIAVLSVHVERPVAHALADGPHVVEAGDVHAVRGDNLGARHVLGECERVAASPSGGGNRIKGMQATRQ